MNLKMNTCAICERSALCEQDHFPIADRHGGKSLWPLCRTCHDLTDRVPLDRWDAMMAWGSLNSLFQRASENERLILVKLAKIAFDASFTLNHQAGNNQNGSTKKPPRERRSKGINYEERVLTCISEHGVMFRSEIQKRTFGKNQKILEAIRRLEEGGQVVAMRDGRIDLADIQGKLAIT